MAEIGRFRGGLEIAAVALVLACCSPSAGECEAGMQSPPRAGRFGTLRDFVLFELVGAVRGTKTRALFVDRFEVTRGDWAEFAFTPSGLAVNAEVAAMLGDRALPVGRVSLRQARAFANWRFARLPRRGEWLAVVRGDGRYRFPWGPFADATRANTAELGLGEPTLVGTFESGRRSVGQPYDLIGNVSEWTETVPVDWCLDDTVLHDSPSLAYAAGRRQTLGMPALAVWQLMPGIVPGITAVAANSGLVPRIVVGADFQSSMRGPSARVLAGDRRLRTGIRLVTTPAELLLSLVAAEVEPTATDYEQLSRFVARRGHRAVLEAAFAEVAEHWSPAQDARPLARWLRQQLGT